MGNSFTQTHFCGLYVHFGFQPLMGPIRHVFITYDGKKFKEILPNYIKVDDDNYLNYKLDGKYKEYKSIYYFK